MIGVATEQNLLYTFKWCDEDVPAWSLSALLEVIPAMIVYPTWVDKRPTDVWFNLDKDYNSETKKQFYVCYYKSLDTHQLAKITEPSHSSPIDAAYEMVCWLLENNLIKKGGLLLILGMVRDQLSEEETVEYLSRVFTIEEIEESESALNFAELTEEDKDKMRDFFNKVKQQIQKNDD